MWAVNTANTHTYRPTHCSVYLAYRLPFLNLETVKEDLWGSGLRIHQCHSGGLGLCCGVGSIPGVWELTCYGCGQKGTKKPEIVKITRSGCFIQSCPSVSAGLFPGPWWMLSPLQLAVPISWFCTHGWEWGWGDCLLKKSACKWICTV